MPRSKIIKGGIPPGLDTKAFRDAWKDFKRHRKEIKHPLTDISRKRLLKKLSMWGERAALVAIDRSICAGWRDVFKPTQEALEEAYGAEEKIDSLERQIRELSDDENPDAHNTKTASS